MPSTRQFNAARSHQFVSAADTWFRATQLIGFSGKQKAEGSTLWHPKNPLPTRKTTMEQVTMARLKVRYLIERYSAGSPGRRAFYWSPSTILRGQGFHPQRVPADWRDILDPVKHKAAAIAEAEVLNRHLDATRKAAASKAPAKTQAHRATTPDRSLAGLVADYKASKLWRRLEPTTQRGYEQCLARLVPWAGDAHVAALTYARIEKLADILGATPSFRDHILRVLRLLLNHACRLGWIVHNPAMRLPLGRDTEWSGLVWPAEAVTAMVEMADRLGSWSIGTAVLLNSWIGQRQGDVLRLHRGIFRDGTLLIRQAKTKAKVALPIGKIPAVADRISEELARIDAAGYRASPMHLIVDEITGRPYTGDNFRHRFAAIRAAVADEMREIAGWQRDQFGAWHHEEIERRLASLSPSERAAGLRREIDRATGFDSDYIVPGRDINDPDVCRVPLANLQFMHLRHTAVVRLSESGCSTELIAAVTGHSLRSVATTLGHYLVKTRQQAGEAFERRLTQENTSRGDAPRRLGKRLLQAVQRANGKQLKRAKSLPQQAS
jgi:hypothetical protein